MYLDANAFEQPLVHPSNSGDLAYRKVMHECFDGRGRKVECKLAIGFVLQRM